MILFDIQYEDEEVREEIEEEIQQEGSVRGSTTCSAVSAITAKCSRCTRPVLEEEVVTCEGFIIRVQLTWQ